MLRIIVGIICIPIFIFMGWTLYVDIKDTIEWKRSNKESEE